MSKIPNLAAFGVIDPEGANPHSLTFRANEDHIGYVIGYTPIATYWLRAIVPFPVEPSTGKRLCDYDTSRFAYKRSVAEGFKPFNVPLSIAVSSVYTDDINIPTGTIIPLPDGISIREFRQVKVFTESYEDYTKANRVECGKVSKVRDRECENLYFPFILKDDLKRDTRISLSVSTIVENGTTYLIIDSDFVPPAIIAYEFYHDLMLRGVVDPITNVNNRLGKQMVIVDNGFAREHEVIDFDAKQLDIKRFEYVKHLKDAYNL